MQGLFENQVAIVTGGASGIGRATAIRFAEEGAKVLVADIDQNKGTEVAQSISAAGGTASFLRVDVALADDNRAMVDAVLERYGRLDIAFNNAGVTGRFTNVVDCTEEEWNSVMDINAKSVWLAMKYEIPAMLRGGGGSIVNTSSAATHQTQKGMATYMASKHAVLGLSKVAAADFAARNIRVSALLPGVTWTPMMERGMAGTGISFEEWTQAMPMGRMGSAEEQAEAVVWLCSRRASYVTGVSLLVDGGAGI